MNDLSRTGERNSNSNIHNHCRKFIPRTAICIIIPVLLTGLGISVFILAVVHNPIFFLSFLPLSSLLLAFVLWNTVSWRRNAALFHFLRSFPPSDLRLARPGHLVKITGPVSCGNVSLESSYEKVARCVYTSTLIYECRGFGLKIFKDKAPFFLWRLAYAERFCTDFYISDKNTGVRTLVKAGYGCKVIPLIIETNLVSTRGNRTLSPNLTKWLTERNLSAESSLIRLEEGYIQEGNCITVIGMLCRGDDGISMVVQPPELISTGCLWKRLLLPVDFDGLILGVTNVLFGSNYGMGFESGMIPWRFGVGTSFLILNIWFILGIIMIPFLIVWFTLV